MRRLPGALAAPFLAWALLLPLLVNQGAVGQTERRAPPCAERAGNPHGSTPRLELPKTFAAFTQTDRDQRHPGQALHAAPVTQPAPRSTCLVAAVDRAIAFVRLPVAFPYFPTGPPTHS